MKPNNYPSKDTNKYLIISSILIVTCAVFIFGYKQYRFIELVRFNKIVGLPAKMALFNSQIGHFSILYPVTWDAGDTPTGAKGDHKVVAAITNFVLSPYIEVSQMQFGSNDINNVISWGQSRANENRGYKKISMQPYATKNNFGAMLEYLRDAKNVWGDMTYHCIDWFISNNNNGYDFSFCINQKNWTDGKPIFYQMIDSIQIMKSQ